MITRTFKYLLSYSERAFTPASYTSLLQERLPNQHPSEILHQLALFSKDITLFDYDYYQACGLWLINHQKKLSVAEILTVLQLGQKHNIKNGLLWAHLQAEIHHRMHRSVIPMIQNEQEEEKQKLLRIYEELEAKSQDYFEILEKDQNQEEGKQNSQTTEIIKPHNQRLSQQIVTNRGLKPIKINSQIIQNIQKIAQTLIWYGCQDQNLLKLTIQTQLHHNVIQLTPSFVLRLAQLLIYTCQVHMNEYNANQQQYTARSLKKIYKYQSDYLPELIKVAHKTLSQFSGEELEYFIEVLLNFPIKKRAHRKQVAFLLTQEYIKRGIKGQAKIEQLLGNDKKLISSWSEHKKNLQISRLSHKQ